VDDYENIILHYKITQSLVARWMMIVSERSKESIREYKLNYVLNFLTGSNCSLHFVKNCKRANAIK
jgi:hypothetical protein